MTHLQLPDDRRTPLAATADHTRPADPRTTVAELDRSRAPEPAPTESGVLVIRPWHDRRLAASGFDLRSSYVERYWLGVLGPSV